MKTKLFNFVARVTAIATIVSSAFMMSPIKAANVLEASDTMTRLAVSTAADHDIRFYSPTAIGIGSTITLTFGAGFTMGSVGDADIDFLVADSTTSQCDTETYTANGSSAEAVLGQVLTVTPGTATTEGRCVQILIGTNTTAGANQITNPGTVTSHTITIGGLFGNDGVIAVPIVDSDQVTVTANVDPSIMFDLDTDTTTNASTSAPYTVDFGTLDPTDSSANVSGTTDGVEYIHMDLETNATHGAVITIENTEGTNGMVSTSDGVDNIVNSSAASTTADTEFYGFCIGGTYVGGSTAATWTEEGVWASGTCVDDTDGNQIVALSSTPTTLLSIDGPVDGGEAYLIGSADASVLTEAHDDYVDVLTFIATATF